MAGSAASYVLNRYCTVRMDLKRMGIIGGFLVCVVVHLCRVWSLVRVLALETVWLSPREEGNAVCQSGKIGFLESKRVTFLVYFIVASFCNRSESSAVAKK